jgi:hypothetical protein
MTTKILKRSHHRRHLADLGSCGDAQQMAIGLTSTFPFGRVDHSEACLIAAVCPVIWRFWIQERQRLSGEQQLAQAERDELIALVLLYKSLGGGWQI